MTYLEQIEFIQSQLGYIESRHPMHIVPAGGYHIDYMETFCWCDPEVKECKDFRYPLVIHRAFGSGEEE